MGADTGAEPCDPDRLSRAVPWSERIQSTESPTTRQNQNRGGMMRLAIAGKGGAGKTTLTATLARLLARRGRHVNAVDDDPNPNLSVALGLDEKARSGLRRVPREEVMEERVDSLGN